jgi:hypothetical protein
MVVLVFRLKNGLDVSLQLCYPIATYRWFPTGKAYPSFLVEPLGVHYIHVGTAMGFLFSILSIIRKLYGCYVDGNHLLPNFRVNGRKRCFLED